jgi:putative acetyltransferase
MVTRLVALIRHEAAAEWIAVDAVVRDAFGGDREATLVKGLRSSPDVLSLVAEVDRRVVGHAMFSTVTLPHNTASLRISALAPVSVVPGMQRRGIGMALIRSGLAELRRSGVGLVVVLGHPTYYGRFGFVPAAPFGIRCRWGGEDGAFQVLELVHGVASRCHGMVSYSPAFDEVSS